MEPMWNLPKQSHTEANFYPATSMGPQQHLNYKYTYSDYLLSLKKTKKKQFYG